MHAKNLLSIINNILNSFLNLLASVNSTVEISIHSKQSHKVSKI